jgi:hypothetical protein
MIKKYNKILKFGCDEAVGVNFCYMGNINEGYLPRGLERNKSFKSM